MKKGRQKNIKNSKNPLRVFIHSELYKNGISNNEFMAKMGMSTVTYYKRLRKCDWNVQELFRIAKLLKVPSEEIFAKLEDKNNIKEK